jgi:O-antigen/teichoic acid export membrane protein
MKKIANIEELFSIKGTLKGASLYSFGAILVQASGLFLIPVFTKYLTPSDFGIVGYLQVFQQAALVIFALGFPGAQIRYLHENKIDKKEIGRFAFSINLLPLVIMVILLLPLTLFTANIDWVLGKQAIPVWPFLIITLWSAVFTVLADNAISFYRAQQRYGIATVLQLARFVFITGFSLYLIVNLQMGALGRVMGMLCGLVCFLIISYGFYASNFNFSFSKKAILYSVSYGAPIVVSQLSTTVHNLVDRLILGQMVSPDTLGIYTLSFMIGGTLQVLIIGFNQAYQPNYFTLMASNSKNKDEKIIRIFKIWLYLLTTFTSLGILIVPYFLRIFVSPEYYSAEVVIPWMFLSVFLGSFYYFFSAPIFYFKKTKWLPGVTFISAITNIALNLLLIPKYGILGAAVATGISHLVMSLMAFKLGNSIYHIDWPKREIGASLIIVSIILMIAQ